MSQQRDFDFMATRMQEGEVHVNYKGNEAKSGRATCCSLSLRSATSLEDAACLRLSASVSADSTVMSAFKASNCGSSTCSATTNQSVVSLGLNRQQLRNHCIHLQRKNGPSNQCMLTVFEMHLLGVNRQ